MKRQDLSFKNQTQNVACFSNWGFGFWNWGKRISNSWWFEKTQLSKELNRSKGTENQEKTELHKNSEAMKQRIINSVWHCKLEMDWALSLKSIVSKSKRKKIGFRVFLDKWTLTRLDKRLNRERRTNLVLLFLWSFRFRSGKRDNKASSMWASLPLLVGCRRCLKRECRGIFGGVPRKSKKEAVWFSNL